MISKTNKRAKTKEYREKLNRLNDQQYKINKARDICHESYSYLQC